EKIGPSTAALVSTLEPVVTVLASALVLSEAITVNIVVGGCLVLAALVVSTLPSREAKSF
ncbi:MAG: DMT family transporter, partial [bacterium]|nr:DMT family transporter [bacterium]